MESSPGVARRVHQVHVERQHPGDTVAFRGDPKTPQPAPSDLNVASERLANAVERMTAVRENLATAGARLVGSLAYPERRGAPGLEPGCHLERLTLLALAMEAELERLELITERLNLAL